MLIEGNHKGHSQPNGLKQSNPDAQETLLTHLKNSTYSLQQFLVNIHPLCENVTCYVMHEGFFFLFEITCSLHRKHKQ